MRNTRGKGLKKAENFFFGFFAFCFWETIYTFFFVYQNENFCWKKAKIVPRKIGKSDFAPPLPCYAPVQSTTLVTTKLDLKDSISQVFKYAV